MTVEGRRKRLYPEILNKVNKDYVLCICYIKDITVLKYIKCLSDTTTSNSMYNKQKKCSIYMINNDNAIVV